MIQIGQRYSRLTVLAEVQKEGRMQFLCGCDCGQYRVVRPGNLKKPSGTKSCGCLGRENAASRFRTHGLSDRPEYMVWSHMKRRCSDSRLREYPRYGGRGIKVCPRWLESFDNFFADMGPRPEGGYEIDRIDNDGNYEPSNCQWLIKAENTKKTRRTIYVDFHGERVCLSDAARLAGMRPATLFARLRVYGWPLDKALSTPVSPSHKEREA